MSRYLEYTCEKGHHHVLDSDALADVIAACFAEAFPDIDSTDGPPAGWDFKPGPHLEILVRPPGGEWTQIGVVGFKDIQA